MKFDYLRMLWFIVLAIGLLFGVIGAIMKTTVTKIHSNKDKAASLMIRFAVIAFTMCIVIATGKMSNIINVS